MANFYKAYWLLRKAMVSANVAASEAKRLQEEKKTLIRAYRAPDGWTELTCIGAYPDFERTESIL